jgi:sugar-specific transcriptional regulator TrmB
VKVQEIIDRLTVLGLDSEEAAVYVHLSIMGPSKASDLAAALKLHRTEAYRTLQNLVQRGFVSATLGRPSRFEAAPPERLFTDILAAQEARKETIQRAQQEIAPALTTLRGQPTDSPSKNTFKVLQGRREIYGVLDRMLREARQGFKSVSTHEGAPAMAEMVGLWDTMRKRAQEGLDIRVVLRTNPASRAKLAPLLEEPSLSLRHWDEPRVLRFVVSDEKELLIWVVSDPSTRPTSEQEVAIWSDAADFVVTQSALFDLAWRESKELRTLMMAEGMPPAEKGGVRR